MATNTSNLQSNASNPFLQSKLSITAKVTSLIVLGSIIVLGNLACLIIFFKTQSLRRKCHYLIISLCVADFCVGGVVFMSIYYHIGIHSWYNINAYVLTLDFLDSLTSNASIFNLVAISLERFHAIFFPFRHRRLRFKHYLACVLICSCISFVLCFPILLAIFIKSDYFLYNQWLFVLVPLLALSILSFSYISIAIKMRRKTPEVPNQGHMLRDQKLVVTLVMVTLVSLVTWLPVQCFGALLYFCTPWVESKFNLIDLVFFIKLLQYCNSAINLFVYIVRMPEFRHAFLRLVIFHRVARDSSQLASATRRMSEVMTFRNRGFELTEMSYGKNRKLDSEISKHDRCNLGVQLKEIISK